MSEPVRIRQLALGVALGIACLLGPRAGFGGPSGLPQQSEPPRLAAILKPELLKRVTGERDILTTARLEDGRYSYYAAMLVRAGAERTRKVLTDYQLYSKLISYVDKTQYSPITRILELEGGIWKFRLRSWVRFEERGDHWVHYQVVGGHFRGLEGNLYFEPQGEKGTLVYMEGSLRGDHWPPKFIIERGAEIVFGFTARRMRNYLESNEDVKPAGESRRHDDENIPRPRSHL